MSKNYNYTQCGNYFTVSTFLATGITLNTLINLKLTDINFEEATIRLNITKNRKAQLLPLPNKLDIVLSKYIRKVKPIEYLFTNRRGIELTANIVKSSIRS